MSADHVFVDLIAQFGGDGRHGVGAADHPLEIVYVLQQLVQALHELRDTTT